MRLIRLTVLALALPAGACTKEQPEASPPADSSSPAVAGTASTTAFSNADIACADVMPPDVSAQVNGWDLEEKQICANCPRECSYSKKDASDMLSVSYDCRIAVGPREIAEARKMFAERKMPELPGLGKAAFIAKPMEGMTQISFWDDDTPCSVNVTANGALSPKATDIAKSVAAYTTPERLK